VLADNVLGDQALAAARYAAVRTEDPLLRSYVVRHRGAHLLETDREAGLRLLYESLDLRIAAGARPLIAGAAALLADVGEERWGPVAETIRKELALA
jgi:hypothetical protein